MKKIKPTLFLCIVLLLLLQSTLSAQKFAFYSLNNPDGNTFYSLDKATGQLYYMHDVGSKAGTWIKYGTAVRATGAANLSFSVISNTNGNVFYALDATTGQLYYMADVGSTAGKWQSYGGLISKTDDGLLILTSAAGEIGNTFYALNSKSGQLYYMNDVGEEAGKWKSYGGVTP